MRLLRVSMDVNTRLLGPEHHTTLNSASNCLACSLFQLGECAKAAVLLRTTLAAQTRTVGADDEFTIATETHLINVLLRLRKCAEAEALCRGSLEKQRRVLSRDHRETLTTLCNLATSLSEQGKYAESLGIVVAI